ncbi:MAG: hypothetical protein KDE48_13630 [Anaerolineales bacterium]|nr:hypothetical protein [Anaerolineales bacterium]
MSTNGKPRIAFFDFTGCEGCQLTVIDALQTYPELLDVVEIVEFREAMSEQAEAYDIAFVEGSCCRESDETRLHDIRERSVYVVALGACAHLGGVNAIRNRLDMDETRHYVYGDYAEWYESYEPRAIADVIDVDTAVPGCPIDRDEFVNMVKLFLQGRLPQPPDYPLCIECKLRENVCVYLRGQVCLGPITRAGCKAVCCEYGIGCEGCRGLISNPQIEPMRRVLAEHGMTEADMQTKLSLFLTNQLSALVLEEEAARV